MPRASKGLKVSYTFRRDDKPYISPKRAAYRKMIQQAREQGLNWPVLPGEEIRFVNRKSKRTKYEE